MEYAGLICDIVQAKVGAFHIGKGVCFMQECCHWVQIWPILLGVIKEFLEVILQSPVHITLDEIIDFHILNVIFTAFTKEVMQIRAKR